MNEEKETIVVIPIPENFASEGTFLGYELKPLNIIQAIVLGAIPIFINYGIIYKYFVIDFLALLGVTAVFSCAFAYIGFAGIDNVTPLEYLMKVLVFRKKERVTFFNPRVKKEIISLYEEKNNEASQPLPRDKVMKMYKEFIAKRNLADQQKAREAENIFGDEQIYFEDDFLVTNKPEEYMSDAELKKLKKERKKAEKQMKAEQKKLEKEQKRNAKKK